MRFHGEGNEQQGTRPGVVIQNNKGNRFSPNVIALPLTTVIKKIYQPTHVILSGDNTGLGQTSMVLCENPQMISKERIGPYITTLSDEHMREIARASLIATPVLAFLSDEDLLNVKKHAAALNQ